MLYFYSIPDEPISPKGYLENIWCLFAKGIIYPLFGHLIIEWLFIRHLIVLKPHIKIMMNNTINNLKGVWILFYLIACFKYGLHEFLNMLHRYITNCIMVLYFVLFIFYLFIISVQHIQFLGNAIRTNNEKVDMNQTYGIMRYLYETTVVQEREVIQMIIYDYLKCPHSVALLIASFVSDLEDDAHPQILNVGDNADETKKER